MDQLKIIENEIVHLDYRTWHRIRFLNCSIVYKGGGVPNVVECEFVGCLWHFEDEALRTLQFLRYLAHYEYDPDIPKFILERVLGFENE